MPLPPPPPPPMMTGNGKKSVITTADPEAGMNALLSDIRNGPRLRSVPKPKEKNIFIKQQQNDHNNNDDDNNENGSHRGENNLPSENSQSHKHPLSTELQAELTSTLKRRQNHKEDDKSGVRTFDPNILNTHKPQPTGFKIGHAAPNFKIQSMKSAPPPVPKSPSPTHESVVAKSKSPVLAETINKNHQIPNRQLSATETRSETLEIKKTFERTKVETVKSPTLTRNGGWNNKTNGEKSVTETRSEMIEIKKTFETKVETTTTTQSPISNGEMTKKPKPIPEKLVISKPSNGYSSPEPKVSVKEKARELVRIVSMEANQKPIIDFLDENFEHKPEGIKPELLSPKCEVRFQIGSAKTGNVQQKSNAELRDEIDRPDPTSEYDIKKLVSTLERPAKFHRDNKNEKEVIPPSNDIRQMIARLNSHDDRNGTLPRAAKANTDHVKTNSLKRTTENNPLKITHPKANFTVQKKEKAPIIPTIQNRQKERTPSPVVQKVLQTPPPVPRRSPSPAPEKQTSTLFRTTATIMLPANGDATDYPKKTIVTTTKSVPSAAKKRPAPKPPLASTNSSPSSPLSPNKSSLFSAYTRSLSQQKNDLNDSGIDVNFETKQQVSFSKDLANAPNNHKDIVKTEKNVFSKAEDVVFGDVNLRQIKIDINDRNSVRVMPK